MVVLISRALKTSYSSTNESVIMIRRQEAAISFKEQSVLHMITRINMLISLLLMAAATMAALLEVSTNSNFTDYSGNVCSPLYQATVIRSDQPYNTNNNWMELEYYATHDEERDLKRLYATMTLHLE